VTVIVSFVASSPAPLHRSRVSSTDWKYTGIGVYDVLKVTVVEVSVFGRPSNDPKMYDTVHDEHRRYSVVNYSKPTLALAGR